MEKYDRLPAANELDVIATELIQIEGLPAGFEIRLYQDGDESPLVPVEDILKEHPSYKSEWKKMLRAGLVMTCLYKGEPIGVGGVFPIKGDLSRAVIWMIVSRRIEKVKVGA